jgi:hypothetical protein
MNWIYGLVALAAIALVFWDAFVRRRRGAALLWSLAAMIGLTATGIARGVGVSGVWPLVGLVVGCVLSAVAERGRDARAATSSRTCA